MTSVLDQKYEAVLAAATGEGGQLVLAQDDLGRHYVANFPATLPQLFSTFAMFHADVECIVSGDERLTYAQINALSDRLAQALVARGIAKGDRIAIAMRNCPAWIVAYMATLKAGGVATLINGWWRSEELQHALDLTEPAMVLADPSLTKRIENCSGDWKVKTVDITQPVEAAFERLLAGGHSAITLPEIEPDDHATILFTSGSTGLAKGALSTHRQVTSATYTYVTSLMVLKGILVSDGNPPPERTKGLVAVPFFHVTGEVPVLLTSYVVGRTLVLMHKWDAGEALRLIEEEKIYAFTGVPTMALELLNHPDRDNYDFSSLGDINSGGAPRPPSHVERQANEMASVRAVQGYGLTETNAVGAGNFWSNYQEKPTSTGRAQPPFVEIRILDDDGNELEQGKVGEIALQAVATIEGYWRDPEATAAAYTDDRFFKTGDVGYLDEEGYLFIVDRKKEIIIRGGENIAASEVESAFYANEQVAEAVVFAAADERLGEVPVAIIYLHPGSDVSEDDLRQFLGARLAAYKVPERMTFVDKPLPRLGTGKIDRVALKAEYGG